MQGFVELISLTLLSVVMMGQTDIESTEHVWRPASCGRLETEALWVDQGNDRERRAAIWKIDAANAAVVFDKNAQEVLVGDALGMAS